jgi:hypothetical protein
MKAIIAICALGLLAGPALAESTPEAAKEAGRPGKILSEKECSDLWSKAAGRTDLSAEQAKPYVTNFEQVDKNSDNKITNDEFSAGCKMGFVQQAAAEPGAKEPGDTTVE